MFSKTTKVTRFQTLVAALLIASSVFFFTPPKQADAIVLLIVLGTATSVTLGAIITAIIIDGIILCAIGVICGSGGGGGSCVDTHNATCRSEENACGDYNTGVIDCDGYCTVGPPADFTGNSCPTNYCGMTGGGNERCDGTCQGGSAVSDSLCSGFPLPDDALVIDPALVRVGDTVDISWNLGGSNWPPTCTLEGEGISVNFTGASDNTGTINNVPVNGPHRYTLTCDDQVRIEDIQVLPDIFDS